MSAAAAMLEYEPKPEIAKINAALAAAMRLPGKPFDSH
jgi:hypothetical protein